MIKRLNSILVILALITFSLLNASCGAFDFANSLQAVLQSGAQKPFIDSLHLGAHTQDVTTDFTDLIFGGTVLATGFKACGDKNKPCDLQAVSKFQTTFDEIIARGHFGLHPKLTQIQTIVRGLILSATIYYGGTVPSRSAVVQSPNQAERDMKQGLKDLKVLMTVN